MDVEAIVVGAGPAGSTAARELAGRGVETLLLDRARFPRDKPCGGGVSMRSAALLPFSLDPVVEDVVSGALIRGRGGRDVELTTNEPLVYMTQRARLDQLLVEQAQATGVEFRDGQTVRGVERLPDGGYAVRTADGEHRAPVVVGADGANGVVRTHLGFKHPAEHTVALEANLPCPGGAPAWLRGRLALCLGVLPGGYGWLFPKADHINIGVGGWQSVVGPQLRDSLEALTRAYGFDPTRLVGRRGHHLPMQRPGAMIAAAGVALVGDAAGLVDPLSGEGIHAAIASGIAVAPAAQDYLSGAAPSLAGYQLTVQRELLPDIEASHALTEIFHAYPEPLMWVFQHSRRFWGRFWGILRGDHGYHDVVHSFGPAIYALRPMAAVAKRITTRRYGRTA